MINGTKYGYPTIATKWYDLVHSFQGAGILGDLVKVEKGNLYATNGHSLIKIELMADELLFKSDAPVVPGRLFYIGKDKMLLPVNDEDAEKLNLATLIDPLSYTQAAAVKYFEAHPLVAISHAIKAFGAVPNLDGLRKSLDFLSDLFPVNIFIYADGGEVARDEDATIVPATRLMLQCDICEAGNNRKVSILLATMDGDLEYLKVEEPNLFTQNRKRTA